MNLLIYNRVITIPECLLLKAIEQFYLSKNLGYTVLIFVLRRQCILCSHPAFTTGSITSSGFAQVLYVKVGNKICILLSTVVQETWIKLYSTKVLGR